MQLCIGKMSYTKLLINKSHHNQHVQQQQLNLTLSSTSSKINVEELVLFQNSLFSIISSCLNALFNYIPNFGDGNYLATLDEYKLLLNLNLAPPSSFDFNSPASFGSILWIIDYCLKLLNKVFR